MFKQITKSSDMRNTLTAGTAVSNEANRKNRILSESTKHENGVIGAKAKNGAMRMTNAAKKPPRSQPKAVTTTPKAARNSRAQTKTTSGNSKSFQPSKDKITNSQFRRNAINRRSKSMAPLNRNHGNGNDDRATDFWIKQLRVPYKKESLQQMECSRLQHGLKDSIFTNKSILAKKRAPLHQTVHRGTTSKNKLPTREAKVNSKIRSSLEKNKPPWNPWRLDSTDFKLSEKAQMNRWLSRRPDAIRKSNNSLPDDIYEYHHPYDPYRERQYRVDAARGYSFMDPETYDGDVIREVYEDHRQPYRQADRDSPSTANGDHCGNNREYDIGVEDSDENSSADYSSGEESEVSDDMSLDKFGNSCESYIENDRLFYGDELRHVKCNEYKRRRYEEFEPATRNRYAESRHRALSLSPIGQKRSDLSHSHHNDRNPYNDDDVIHRALDKFSENDNNNEDYDEDCSNSDGSIDKYNGGRSIDKYNGGRSIDKYNGGRSSGKYQESRLIDKYDGSSSSENSDGSSSYQGSRNVSIDTAEENNRRRAHHFQESNGGQLYNSRINDRNCRGPSLDVHDRHDPNGSLGPRNRNNALSPAVFTHYPLYPGDTCRGGNRGQRVRMNGSQRAGFNAGFNNNSQRVGMNGSKRVGMNGSKRVGMNGSKRVGMNDGSKRDGGRHYARGGGMEEYYEQRDLMRLSNIAEEQSHLLFPELDDGEDKRRTRAGE